MSKLLSRQEAAEYLGVSYHTLSYWAGGNSKESLPFHKYGKVVKYRVEDLDKFLNDRRVE